MTHSLTDPTCETYIKLIDKMKGSNAMVTALDLCTAGWRRVYGGSTLQTSYILVDPTGEWAVKVTGYDNEAYSKYVAVAMDSHDGPESNVPFYACHERYKSGGSVTLMEKLEPLGKGPSILFDRQKDIAAAALIQHRHNTFSARLSMGTEQPLREKLGDDDRLIHLAEVLSMVMTLTRTNVALWQRSDIMRRSNGTEVLVDPFEPVANLAIGKPTILRAV